MRNASFRKRPSLLCLRAISRFPAGEWGSSKAHYDVIFAWTEQKKASLYFSCSPGRPRVSCLNLTSCAAGQIIYRCIYCLSSTPCLRVCVCLLNHVHGIRSRFHASLSFLLGIWWPPSDLKSCRARPRSRSVSGGRAIGQVTSKQQLSL